MGITLLAMYFITSIITDLRGDFQFFFRCFPPFHFLGPSFGWGTNGCLKMIRIHFQTFSPSFLSLRKDGKGGRGEMGRVRFTFVILSPVSGYAIIATETEAVL